ncbi:protein phosphatase 2C [Plectosphaerella cucumerina]|uniref:Adenylate cyclase n=1 Tax=Plectosphaerella cucumerina TaxID=40658 RepID=A0A8K0X8Z9_9PEZI|nr:protein phosphatase 2C [Plectosphaerella cucumerina]
MAPQTGSGGGGNISSSINNNNPTTGSNLPTPSMATSFYNDDSDMSAASPLSPAFRIGNAPPPRSGHQQQQQQQQQQQTMGSLDVLSDIAPFADERRPSLASIATASSQGSKSSIRRGGLQKLQGFFGEEFPGRDSSETSLQSSLAEKNRSHSYSHGRPTRERNYSNATDHTREASPTSSRPRTPVPAPEVVPFLYQNSDDIARYGEAPVGESLTGPDRQRFEGGNSQVPPKTSSSGRSAHSGGHSHGIGLHHHRHNRSIDDGRALRPSVSREDSQTSLQIVNSRERGGSAATVLYASSKARAQSPTPSAMGNYFANNPAAGADGGQTSPGHQPKKKLFDRFRRHKETRDDVGPGPGPGTPLPNRLPNMPGSARSLVPKGSRPDLQRLDKNAAAATFPSNWPATDAPPPQDGSRPQYQPRAATFNNKFPFSKKGRTHKPGDPLDEYIGPTDRQDGRNDSVFHLDTNLNDMEGILTKPPPLTPLDNSFIQNISDPDKAVVPPPVAPIDPVEDPSQLGQAVNGSWNAPDSWAVRRTTEDSTYHAPDAEDVEGPSPQGQSAGNYCIRVFKTDNTFSTMSLALDSLLPDLISQVIKKSYKAEGPEAYQIALFRHGQMRMLNSNERPLLLQKRLLEQVGYEEKDKFEDLGREDHSYICRFVFLSTKEGDYRSHTNVESSWWRGMKFNHVDLSDKNLLSVPIALYSKANEIISINFSRNLSIDIPRDFIQSCQNLRDIKLTRTEIRRPPPSLGKASKLTYLDLANNRLETLEGAELEALTGILKFNFASNRLKSLPPFFGAYKHLRSLNVASNFLEEFPKFLCDIDSLVELDMSFNVISTIPDEIGELRALEKLVMTNNRLNQQLPGTFRNLTALRELNVKYNCITSIDIIAEMPTLEIVTADHNSISRFKGSFSRVRILKLNSNPITAFEINAPVLTLKVLNLCNCQLASMDESFNHVLSLEHLMLDNNYFVSLPAHIGNLSKLEHFSIANNSVGELPPTIGCLTELRHLDVRNNNMKKLPMEIWWANKLETLNASSNVLDNFPRPASRQPRMGGDETPQPGILNNRGATPATLPPPTSGSDDSDASRRPSQVSSSTLLSVGPSPVPPGPDRKSSVVSVYGKGGRKTSVMSRSTSQGTIPPVPQTSAGRKDSGLTARLSNTFAGSLRNLYLADNQLEDEVFDQITKLNELRVLNLSYNDISDMPQRSIKAWPQLVELYLSGNELTTIPADDLEDGNPLKVLHINNNKFTNLPADISRAKKLVVLDCGSNSLKYNIENVPYDWNWNLNLRLRYLNLSGNKRLEIKQSHNGPYTSQRESLADFGRLTSLRLLGLMDVTLPTPNIPEQNEDRRIRTSGSTAGNLAYGMADTLGKNEHLSTMDLVVPRFNASETETLLGLFDGQTSTFNGSRIAKYLHENFGHMLTHELKNLKSLNNDTPVDALRRTFLNLNRDLIIAASQQIEDRPSKTVTKGQAPPVVLAKEDVQSGGVATVAYLQGSEIYVANVGDVQAMLIQTDGSHKMLTRKHDPAEPNERLRIREAGYFVGRSGKINEALDVSRAFGYQWLLPGVQAAPYITNFTVREQDEILLMGTRELWEYMSPGLVVDVVRGERGDLMRAAQKLRDLAIAYGCTNKIMVMLVSLSDVRRRMERAKLHRGQSMSLYPSGLPENLQNFPRRVKKVKGEVLDSTLSRLEAEIDPPTGNVSIAFTDIKNSTNLWEVFPAAMRSAIKIHNEVMRRQLRRIGGYEVKTEGDAFMVSFPTPTSALLWCFAVQMQLLEVEWPPEILNSLSCQPLYDKDNTLIFKGLSVRMGIHFGDAVNEMDPVTGRMDYFGPMVNKASRISAVADGGQITVSTDFISEVQRCLETSADIERLNSTASSEDTFDEDSIISQIRRDLRSLSSQGFEVKDLGERKLKGLENPETIYSLYPHALIGRADIHMQHERGVETQDKPATLQPGSELSFDPDIIWNLWRVSLRLEMLCSALENGAGKELQAPETELLERMKQRGGEVTERFLLNFMEHQVSRVEACTTTLALRHMVAGNGPITTLSDLQGPVSSALNQLAAQMAELQKYKARFGELSSIEDGEDEDDDDDDDEESEEETDEGSDTEQER